MSSARIYQSAAHRFLRNPNVDASIFKRAWSRASPFENTFTLLEDPKTGKKVYLIGTTNSSTILGTRTKKLIEEVKPQSVYVQTSLPWYERASKVEVENQEQFNRLKSGFDDLMFLRANEYPMHVRGLYFRMRLSTWMTFMNYYLSFPNDFNPLRPGVEMLWAIKAAEKTGANIKFLGSTFNKYTVASLARENNIGLLRPLWKVIRGESFSNWRRETSDQFEILRTHGGAAYGENMDTPLINWWTKWFGRLHPEMKHVLIDSEDLRFLDELLNDGSKNIVAVVNQWHLPGISTYWRRHTYTEEKGEFINPIGDMDINAIQEGGLINEMLRRLYTKNSKSEPAAWSSYLTHYHKSVMEPERERHVFFEGFDDHHMEHGLFNAENDHLHHADHTDGHGHDLHGSMEDKASQLADYVGNKEAASIKDVEREVSNGSKNK